MTKKLAENINIAELLKDAQSCDADVTVNTTEGDCLNLKSTLSQYVLLVLAEKPEIFKMAELHFEPQDAARMSVYVQD